jgi:hypothetical protein
MSKNFPSQGLDKFVLRLPTGMRERIGGAARANNRSMNSEIVARLEQSFDQESGQTDKRSKLAAARLLAWPSGSGEFEARLQSLEQEVNKLSRKARKKAQ